MVGSGPVNRRRVGSAAVPGEPRRAFAEPGGAGCCVAPAARGGVVSTTGMDAWHRRLGRRWARALRPCRLGSASTVVEIGPGFAAKIGYGLAELDFRGTLILVEPNHAARAEAVRRY